MIYMPMSAQYARIISKCIEGCQGYSEQVHLAFEWRDSDADSNKS